MNSENKRTKIIKIIVALIAVILGSWGIIIFLQSNPLDMPLKDIFVSRENMQTYVKGYGAIAPLIFFIIQTLQVIVVPIPGNVTAFVGGALFGLWDSFLLSMLGLLTGSLIAFTLARLIGRNLVEIFVKKNIIEKYIDSLSGKYTIGLFILFLLPFFPDDALCFIAGLTSITYPIFIVLVLGGRSIGMIFASLTGSGTINIEWWGWAIIISISGIFIFLTFKYGDKIEAWLLLKMKNKTKVKN
jgi:uncharacterized membrane protein YdjX (TVP38/TMEM64 family)